MNFSYQGSDKTKLHQSFHFDVFNTFKKSVDVLCKDYGFTFQESEVLGKHRIDFYTDYKSDIAITKDLLRRRKHKELLQYVLDKETGVLQV